MVECVRGSGNQWSHFSPRYFTSRQFLKRARDYHCCGRRFSSYLDWFDSLFNCFSLMIFAENLSYTVLLRCNGKGYTRMHECSMTMNMYKHVGISSAVYTIWSYLFDVACSAVFFSSFRCTMLLWVCYVKLRSKLVMGLCSGAARLHSHVNWVRCIMGSPVSVSVNA